MITKEEAKQFVTHSMKMWSEGRVDQIEKLYSPDVVGHSNNQEFYYDDIVQRMQRLGEYSEKRRYSVFGDMEVIDDLVLFRARLAWLTPKDNSLCVSYIVVMYRLRELMITELWILSDLDIEDYVSVNQNMEKNFNQFDVSGREKSNFLQKMTDMLDFQDRPMSRLSGIEVECLFYYLNGYSAKEVAREMGISYRTVEGYIARIKEKFACSTRGQLRLCLFPNATPGDD